MGSDTIQDGSASVDYVGTGEMEAESNNVDSLDVISSRGDIIEELDSASKSLTRVELDLACCSEKLVNLDILVMHVASRENDFEAFALEGEHTLEGSVEKAFQFDLLYGFLDSEIRELDSFLLDLQTDVVTSGKVISSFKQLGNGFREMEERLRDCEESLERSFEQVADMKVQSANFQRILLTSSEDEKLKYDKEFAGLENGDLSNVNTKIRMQTSEQQRHILRMLEKSLAREMDFEKKLAEARQIEEDLKFRLQQEVIRIEEEAEIIWERLFEAENSSDILLGILNELVGRIQMAQFDLNGYKQREGELIMQCKGLNEQLQEKDLGLQHSERSRGELLEKVNVIEQKLSEYEAKLHSVEDSSEQNKESSANIDDRESMSDETMEKGTEAEKQFESSESECKLLRESNMELNNDLCRLRSEIADATERVGQLESQLRDSEIKRLHAEASAEASEEKQNMLNCTIKDMEDLIRDLKSKVSKAESQTESTEDKCITLSESNAELVVEVNFLRGRVAHLETSLHQADDAKKETVKDVKMYTKVIADLVTQLALERERLHKQISTLVKGKKVVVKHLKQMKEDNSFNKIKNPAANIKLSKVSNFSLDRETSGNGSHEKRTGSTVPDYQIPDDPGDSLTSEIRMEQSISASKLEYARNIEPSQLNFKFVVIALIGMVISLVAAYLFQCNEWQNSNNSG
ncbi:WPP domain-interacting tail-anchored protein 1 [Dorcoceras hygrometricum]|uniref:WPP domain-interacting tail-anchored protein 1 n=1 Tax=Dorcoceras hygrometricum TaxID=472368 RepID=A0A2Z7AI53_9LAMI|nr:WPP domain-interacting tail-anchored protein 1 [Dorcoceras hygrometricum]